MSNPDHFGVPLESDLLGKSRSDIQKREKRKTLGSRPHVHSQETGEGSMEDKQGRNVTMSPADHHYTPALRRRQSAEGRYSSP